MRYYGEEYLNELTREIIGVHDSVDIPCFAAPIKGVDVSARRSSLKSADISIAQSADRHIDEIRDKLMKLYSSISLFYGEVDAVSSGITQNARTIKEILKASTASLNELTNMLAGVGDYSGTEITADDIKKDALDRSKYKKMAGGVWEYIIDTQIKDEYLNDDAAKNYIDYVRSHTDSGEELTTDEYNRLKDMYRYYVKHRFGSDDKIDFMDPKTYNNAVDIYEILDPKAKKIMDDLFDANAKDISEAKHNNIQRIKYATYTADPKYRDIIICYSDTAKIRYHNGDKNDYKPVSNTMRLNMEKDSIAQNGPDSKNEYRYCSFFHELGHQVDDFSNSFGGYSNTLGTALRSDLRDHMINVAQTEGPDSINDKDRNEVIDFIISSKNTNVKPGDYTPKNWNNDQKKLFDSYKEYYGYTEYTFLKGESDGYKYNDESVNGSGEDVITKQDHAIISDIIGGATNNQIGGHGESHYPEINRYSLMINNAKDIKTKLENYRYWYALGIPTNKLGAEFIAECFELSVFGSDLDEAGKIFGNSCDEYKKFIDDTYASLPEDFKHTDF